MSRNGSGVYNLPAGNPVVTNTTISSTWANNTLTDIATALTGSLSADGQTTATGALQMGSNKITGLANGTLSTDAVALGQLGTMAVENANAVAITGGAIDGTTIGTTTRADGKFTTLAANGDVSLTSTGFLLIPSGTTAQRPASPAVGEIRYNTTLSQFEGYANSAWTNLGSGAAGSNTQVQYNNSGTLAGSSALTFDGTTLSATAIKTNTLNTTTGVLATQNGMTGIAKAWVNFQGGQGNTAGTINGSFNVSSITVNGTGDYTANFTTAMPNTTYSVIATSEYSNTRGDAAGFHNVWASAYPTTTSSTNIQTTTGGNTSSYANVATACIAVFSS